MRHKASRFLLITTVFFFLSLYTIPSFCDDHPYTDKIELESTVPDIIAAILEKNVDGLMELSHLPGSFQLDKRHNINNLLKDYFDRIIETSEIEVKSIKIKSNEEAEVMVLYSQRYNRYGHKTKKRSLELC